MVGYSPWGCKESDTAEQLHFLSLSMEFMYHDPFIHSGVDGCLRSSAILIIPNKVTMNIQV